MPNVTKFKFLVSILLLGLSIGCSKPKATEQSLASPEPFIEGQNYRLLSTQPQDHNRGGETIVRKYFWYKCPHCYRFLDLAKSYEQGNLPSNTKFESVPFPEKKWELEFKDYYLFEELGIRKDIEAKFWDAIHVDKRPFNTEEQVAEFIAENTTISAADALSAFANLDITAEYQRIEAITKEFGIKGTPTFTINDRYLVTPNMVGNSISKLDELIRYLIKKEQS